MISGLIGYTFEVIRVLEVLGSQKSVKILELFSKNPDKEFYSKEVGEEVGTSKATTIKWLKCLTEWGVLVEKSRGRKKYYKLRWGHPLARQIRILITLSELISAFSDLSEIRSAYLVGASARGTDPPDSPVEILLLKRGDSRRIRNVLDEVSSRIGREIDARIMSPLEYAELARDRPKLHERLEREKIRLVFS